MKLKLIRLLIFSILAFSTSGLTAQESNDLTADKSDYRAEIGISGGGAYYIGDASSKFFNLANIRTANGGFLRYRLDNRAALKAEMTGTVIAGEGIADNMIFTGDLALEYNFFELEQNPYKRMSKIYSPYLLVGGSLLYYTYDKNALINPAFAFGLGMKLKLGNRWNLNLQWTNRLLLADNLEGNPKFNDTNGLNGSNIFNNDLLSTLTIGISFYIWKKECNCMTLYKDK